MKLFALLLAVRIAATAPQSSSTAAQGCKLIPGDKNWPEKAVWQSSLPNVLTRAASRRNQSHPDYKISAKSVTDVQAAVKFASTHNVRLSILNSGHDFLGRNDAPSGLNLYVGNLKGLRVTKSFSATKAGVPPINSTSKAEKIVVNKGEQAYVTFGAGMSTQTLNDALAPSELFTLGAGHGEVSVAGGWGQAGGHSPLGIHYGLGADQVVEYKVVTADGQLRVANSVSEPDLFWALRGGGGGTFGVVVEATIKAFASPKIAYAAVFLNTTDYKDQKSIYDPVAYLHTQFPELVSKGVSGFYFVFPNAIKGFFFSLNEKDSKWAESTWKPILDKMSSYPGINKALMIDKYDNFPNFKAFFDFVWGPMDQMMAHNARRGTDLSPGSLELENMLNDMRLARRHGPGEVQKDAVAQGIEPIDSRLLGKAHFEHPKFAEALEKAMPLTDRGQLRGNLVSGLKIHELAGNETSVHPAWRKAYTHILATGNGGLWGRPDMSLMKNISLDSGAYSNEASTKETNWKTTFWGPHYERLSSIKTKYDPEGVFWITPGINADHFSVSNGRVCPVATASRGQYDKVAPVNDNTNPGRGMDADADGPQFPLLYANNLLGFTIAPQYLGSLGALGDLAGLAGLGPTKS